MSKLTKPERLAIQQKRDKETQLKDIQNRQFELFLNGPSYVDLASALTPKKQFHYDVWSLHPKWLLWFLGDQFVSELCVYP